MTLKQAQRLSERLADAASSIDERADEDDVSSEEAEVMTALFDCHEALEKIITRWEQN